jgi:hypothetical protein
MRLYPVSRPQTLLELSLVECTLEGSGIRYIVNNRYMFGLFGLPPVPGYSDCCVYVSFDDFDDAQVLLETIKKDVGETSLSVKHRLRAIVETYVSGHFVARGANLSSDADSEDDKSGATSAAQSPQ